MYEEFETNVEGTQVFCAFTDDGIICRNSAKNRFYPYGSIDKIKLNSLMGVLDIYGTKNGELKGFFYTAWTKEEKSRLKDLVVFAKNKMKSEPKTDVVEMQPQELTELIEKYRPQSKAEPTISEFRMKCNVCGNIFCFTKKDLENNSKNYKSAVLSSAAGLAGAFSGQYAASAVYQQNATQAMGAVVDYNKCPKCNSTDIALLGQDETASKTVPESFSVADEIKKFKELFDAGVITQDEFDAKKQQLLNA